MSSTPSISAIIFDMDGVLCDSESFICEAACSMFEKAHWVKVAPEDFLPFVGTGEDRYLGGVAEKHGVALILPRDKTTTYDIYLQIIQGRLQALPGAREFIAGARKQGLKLAVATSADRIKLEGNLKQIGIPPASFDAIVSGDEVERKKPDPQVFLLAAKRLGIAPDHCLVVEDAITGVQAAKAAGAWCLGLTTSFPAETLRAAGADFIAADLAHVPPEALGQV